MLFAIAFTTSYGVNEVFATDPNWHGHKWFWEETDYRYGSMTGFTGISGSEIYDALDEARTAVGEGSDYHADKVTNGGNWITKTYWTDVTKYGAQHPSHDWLNYVDGSDIELNYNSNITWYDGTTNTMPNIIVAIHELFHGADMDHVTSTGSAMYHSYSYSDWDALSTDDKDKMEDIYG